MMLLDFSCILGTGISNVTFKHPSSQQWVPVWLISLLLSFLFWRLRSRQPVELSPRCSQHPLSSPNGLIQGFITNKICPTSSYWRWLQKSSSSKIEVSCWQVRGDPCTLLHCLLDFKDSWLDLHITKCVWWRRFIGVSLSQTPLHQQKCQPG